MISGIDQQELLAVDLSIEVGEKSVGVIDIDQELARVNGELQLCMNEADRTDYALSAACGILAGAVDAFFIGETTITKKDIALSHEQVNRFIQGYAKARGFKHERLKDAIADLEDAFKVAQDNIWKGKNLKISTKNHHLADLAHHPTPLGLMSAILVRYLQVGIFLNRDGEWHLIPVDDKKNMLEALGPVIISGFLNWLVAVAENQSEEMTGQELPESFRKLIHMVASAPLLIDIAKCADNWFGHLVSDMGGSKSTAGAGMGIPGLFISFLYELSGLPGLKNTGFPQYVNDLYEKQKWNLRRELAYVNAAKKQAIPVVLNEILVRTVYFVTRLMKELNQHNDLRAVAWDKVIPLNNRTVDRMLTVASLSFTAADVADAAVHAALDSAGNWVMFAGRFATRFNYVGAGRAAFAVVREISDEQKEYQLLHEKRILTEAKTRFVIQELDAYKMKLEEQLATYIAEDISVFMAGLDDINRGLASGDSNLVIKGNVVIQRILGKEPQFSNQDEFDALMEADIPLVF